MSELENCCICFEHIEQLYTKWSCNHYFHEDCIKEWNHACPLCRTQTRCVHENETQYHDYPTNNIMTINHIRKLINVPQHCHYLYLNVWNKRSCIDQDHEMLIKSPYGTIVVCVNYNLIKTFNRLH